MGSRGGRASLPAALAVAGALCGAGAAGPPEVRGGPLRVGTVEAGLGATLAGLGRGPAGPTWVGWSVAAVAGGREMCCISGNRSVRLRGVGRLETGAQDDGVCRLASEGHWVALQDGHGEAAAEPFSVLARLRDGRVERLQVASARCSLDTGGLPLLWLDGVPAADSVAQLARLVQAAPGDERVADPAITAIALHDHPSADAPLRRFATGQYPHDLRRDALFWLGHARGRSGFDLLRSVAQREDDPSLRRAALAGLSGSPVPAALDLLIRAARRDPDPEVRREALFWLARQAGDRVAGVLREALERDPETDVKRAAVFGLANLPPDEGVPLLIDLVRHHRNPEVRREAMLWLAESGDPRALELIEEILTG